MRETCLTLINKRYFFYQRNYRHVVVLNMSLMISIVCLFLALLYLHKTRPAPRYFPTTPDGIQITDPPLTTNHLDPVNFTVLANGLLADTPSIPARALRANDQNAIMIYWAERAVLSLFDFDYINFARALQDVRKYFTLRGHQNFLIALSESKNIETVKLNKSIVTAKVAGETQVVKTGIIGKGDQARLAWKIEVPIDVQYNNGVDQLLTQKLLAKLFIVRVSTLQSLFYGLAINEVNFAPRV